VVDFVFTASYQQAGRSKLENCASSFTYGPFLEQTVYDSPDYHRWGETDTIEHALLQCPTVVTFWRKIEPLLNKISNSNLPVTDSLKLLGKIPCENDPFSKQHVDLIN